MRGVRTEALCNCARRNPFEFVKTHALGIWNVLGACIGEGVKKVAALTTDETSSAIIVYGPTRSSADNAFVAAKNHTQMQGTWLPVLKHGHVMGSRDSFLPLFEGKIAASGARADQRLTHDPVSEPGAESGNLGVGVH